MRWFSGSGDLTNQPQETLAIGSIVRVIFFNLKDAGNHLPAGKLTYITIYGKSPFLING
jgi:hypothetical protein